MSGSKGHRVLKKQLNYWTWKIYSVPDRGKILTTNSSVKGFAKLSKTILISVHRT